MFDSVVRAYLLVCFRRVGLCTIYYLRCASFVAVYPQVYTALCFRAHAILIFSTRFCRIRRISLPYPQVSLRKTRKSALLRAFRIQQIRAFLSLNSIKFDALSPYVCKYPCGIFARIRRFAHARICDSSGKHRILQVRQRILFVRNEHCGESAFFYASLRNIVLSAAHNRQIDAIAQCRCGQCATILAQKSQGNVDRIEYTSDFTVHTAENLDFIARKRKYFAFCGKHFISFRRVCGSKPSAPFEKYAKNPQAPLLFGGQN